MKLAPSQIDQFRNHIYDYYSANRRTMPWREDTRGYYILVSEIMLQQTQVSRVIVAFERFIEAFPTISALAGASQADVIRLWSGLGYNRRARFLHQSAQAIVKQYKSQIPDNHSKLVALPGIGPNTAAAILAYTFNRPVVYIETNIRSVCIDYFFSEEDRQIDDSELLDLIEQVLDEENPREWYWALMDYGAYLKTNKPNPSRRSKQHAKQSAFEGSKRQVRGRVLSLLGEHSRTMDELQQLIADERLVAVLQDLAAEQMIRYQSATDQFSLD